MAYPNGKKHYTDLNEAEKWDWHSSAYAFHHVYHAAPLAVGSSPCDPDGEWFNKQYVELKVLALRRKRPDAKPFEFTDEELEDRAEWARLKGYEHWHAFLDAVHEGRETVRPFIAWSMDRRGLKPPPEVGMFKQLGGVVTAPSPPSGEGEGGPSSSHGGLGDGPSPAGDVPQKEVVNA